MSVGDTLRKNLEFWHWYPRFLCEGLTDEQLPLAARRFQAAVHALRG